MIVTEWDAFRALDMKRVKAALAAPVTLPPGGRYFVAAQEAADGDAFVAMSDAAAATTPAHRDGPTLLSDAGPGPGAGPGQASPAHGGVGVREGDARCTSGAPQQRGAACARPTWQGIGRRRAGPVLE